jgi:hypothetical protein
MTKEVEAETGRTIKGGEGIGDDVDGDGFEQFGEAAFAEEGFLEGAAF